MAAVATLVPLPPIGIDREPDATAKLDGLRRVVLIWGASRTALWLALSDRLDGTAAPLTAVVLALAAAVAFWPRFERHAPWLALPALLLQLGITWPFTDNHFFVELLVVVLLGLAGGRGFDRPVLHALWWTIALTLFHTGLQKVLHAQYFGGEFLSFMIGRGERFADAFAWLVGHAEVERLAGLDPMRTGQGPFRAAAPGLVVASNLVWILEMALAVGLLVPAARTVCAAGAIALVLVIQLGAREFGFALLFGNLLLSFVPGRLGLRAVPVVLGLLLVALAAALGLLPGGAWLSAESL